MVASTTVVIEPTPEMITHPYVDPAVCGSGVKAEYLTAGHPGWVPFAALSFARGDQLTGSLVAQNTPRTADEAHVAGTFVAEVCGCRRYDCPRGSAW